MYLLCCDEMQEVAATFENLIFELERRHLQILQRPHFHDVVSACLKRDWKLERVIRIELTYDAWEAPALPLSYTRVVYAGRSLAGGGGLVKCAAIRLRAASGAS